MALLKKFLIITLILFLISLILLLGNNFSIIQKKVTIKLNKNQPQEIGLGIKLISTKLLPFFQVNKNYILFANQKGEVFKFAFQKQKIPKKFGQFRIKPQYKIERIIWSPKQPGQGIIIFDSYQKTKKKEFFNLNNNQYQTLDPNIGQISFSPDGQQIIYQYSNPQKDQSFISIANHDGTKWKNIIATRLKNLSISWKNGEIATFHSLDFSRSSLFSLNIISHQINQIFNYKQNLKVISSPFSSESLVSFLDPHEGQQVYWVNLINRATKKLQIKTSANQCAFGSPQKIYCAIPKNPLSYNTLKMVAKSKKLISQDDLFSINLKTGQIKKIILPEGSDNFSIKKIKISPNNKYLFFLSRNNWLYQVRI